jgi:hypothetical protein
MKLTERNIARAVEWISTGPHRIEFSTRRANAAPLKSADGWNEARQNPKCCEA